MSVLSYQHQGDDKTIEGTIVSLMRSTNWAYLNVSWHEAVAWTGGPFAPTTWLVYDVLLGRHGTLRLSGVTE